jgi:hypothetical protein
LLGAGDIAGQAGRQFDHDGADGWPVLLDEDDVALVGKSDNADGGTLCIARGEFPFAAGGD